MSSDTPIGRYSVHSELASGGMASVYFARLLGPSGFTRTVALKRPNELLAKDHEFAMMFIDEARLAARIRHPNVVSTLDVIATPGELALVMDYVHGESLAKLSAAAKARGEKVPLPIAAAILIDALHGLHAAHEATDERGQPLGIVHRDVSPQNMIVGADGITRIADFGIAKAAGRLRTTKDGAVKGKYAYMAPEQIRGEAVDRTTDTYAAAIVLWELLTGRPLFRGESEAETIYKCLEAEIPPPSTFAPELPPVFDDILRRALARAPSERPATARALAGEIERAAPAVRASEIGAWVEGLARETLAARTAILAAMDSGASLPAGASTVPGGALGVTDPSQLSQLSDSGMVAERAVAPHAKPRYRRATFVAVAALLAGLFGTLLFVGRSVAPAPPLPVSASLAPPAISSMPLVASAASAAPSVMPSTAPTASASTAPPARGAGTKRSAACTPPFTIDSRGREIFKLECL
jgi:eukaryotic-like serine/threonine-protein kinase